MKKTITLLLVAAIIATLFIGLTACYVSRPDTMDHLVGTYALTSYTRKAKDAPSEEEATDMIKEKGIVAYLIIKNNGTGYYVYKDNNTALFARSIKITYSYDEDHSESVKEIRYTDGLTSSGDGYPGKGMETLGLNFSKKEKRLTYTMPAVFGRNYSQTVRYEKVDDSTGLSYAGNKLGTTIVASDYELNGLGLVHADCSYYDGFPYLYMIYDIRPAEKKADFYYAMKEDEVACVERNLDVSWSVASETENTLNITIGDRTYTRYSLVMNNYLFATYPATENYSEVYLSLMGDSREISEIISSDIENYHTHLEYLNQQEESELID